MKTAFEIVTVLNNLIETNIYRINNYEKAAAETEDPEIKDLCNSFASQSRGFKTQLEQLVREYNGKPLDGISVKGAIFRNKEITHPLSDSKKSVLSFCESREDAALENYKHAKIDSLGFPARVVSIILNQNSEITRATERIRFFQNVLAVH